MPKVIARDHKPSHPYDGVTPQATLYGDAQVSLRLRSDEMDVDVEDADGTRFWNIRLPGTEILGSGSDYSLQICAQGKRFNTSNPWYPLSPFFYQNDAHTFFVKPMPAPAMLDPGGEGEFVPLPAGRQKTSKEALEEATAEAGVVDVPPREIKESFGVSRDALYRIKYGNDWLIHSEMGLKFGDSVIGEKGCVPPPGPDSERSARDRCRAVVGGAGLDSATLTELRRSVLAGSVLIGNAPISPIIPH